MSKVTFPVDDTLKRIIEHARNSTEFNAGFEAKPEPALFFVHDHGVYLMSAGKPGLLKEGTESSHVVAYAKGMNPDTDPDWWERARDAVGGDDFGEPLPLLWFTRALDAGATTMILTCSPKSIRFTALLPKPPKVKAKVAA